MLRYALPAVLTTALGAVAVLAGGRGELAERPYEEALYRVALQQNAPAGLSDRSVWSEHPPLAYLMLKLAKAVGGDRIEQLRYAWLAMYLFAFWAALRFAQAGEQEAVHPCGSTRRGHLLRSAVVTSAFVSPLLLVRATRIGPDVPSFAGLAVLLVAGERLMTNPGYRSAAIFGAAAVLLAGIHVYGLVVATSLVLAATAVLLCGRQRPCAVPALITIVAVVSVPLALGRHDLETSLRSVVNHYWAAPVVLNTPGVPLTDAWHVGTELTRDGGYVGELLQGASMGLLVWVVVAAGGPTARWAAAGALLSAAGFWVWERVVGERVVVAHWLGMVWLLGFTAAARGLSGLPLVGAAGAAVVGVLLPGLGSVFIATGCGPDCLRRAGEEIEQAAGPDGTVVFGGTRAFIMFAPDLSPSVTDRSYVYLRGDPRPDNFVGRRLIPDDRLIPDKEWNGWAAPDRLVTVRVEAAQKVEIPDSGWRVVHRRRFIHPANSVGEITVEIRQRAR